MVQKGIWCIQTIIIITISVYEIGTKKMSTEEFAFFISIVTILVKSLDNFGYMYGKYKQAILNARTTQLAIRERKEQGYNNVSSLKDRIAVQNLSLNYGEKIILDDVSFEIKKGEKVAVIGKNGEGKSSLIKSILKINKATGNIFVDKTDTKSITDSSFKQLFSFVPQNPILFNDTVLNNIKYGNQKLFDDDIYQLSKKLGLHSSITRLNKGYETMVGEQGKLLSGGERQKVAVLRALIRDSPILIMDEPTSSLDKNAENLVLNSIMQIDDLTVISIVHNLELVHIFDKLLIVGNTKVQEVDPNTFQISMLQ